MESSHGKKGVQGSKIALVRSYLRVPKAAGQVKILKFLVKIKFYPYMPIIFVMQGKCPFSDISRPGVEGKCRKDKGHDSVVQAWTSCRVKTNTHAFCPSYRSSIYIVLQRLQTLGA